MGCHRRSCGLRTAVPAVEYLTQEDMPRKPGMQARERTRVGERESQRDSASRGNNEVMPSELPPRRVLILTGAGASSNLGANGSHLPMMSSWASDLVRDVGPRAEQIRLRPDMPGEEFEQELGRFLAFERSFPLIEPFAHLGTTGAHSYASTGT
jgi:hypothetical protein